jgi:hypothetical protein
MREPCANYAVWPAVSAVVDDDFAEMGAALEVAVCGRHLFKREYPVNDGRNRCNAIALFIASKSAQLPTLIEPRLMLRPPSRSGWRMILEVVAFAAVPGLVLFAELFARLACGVDCTRVNGHQAATVRHRPAADHP